MSVSEERATKPLSFLKHWKEPGNRMPEAGSVMKATRLPEHPNTIITMKLQR